MRYFLPLIFMAGSALGLTKIYKNVYSHGTVGTTAIDAIAAANVVREIKGWTICHDGGSASSYLAFSDTADPDVDGTRLAPGECYECEGCSIATLRELNVKGQAAATGYSLIQRK